jgi:hypothetical protein
MHHKGTLTIGNAAGRPYHLQCVCGTGGDFAKEEAAVNWFSIHTSRIGASETSELYVPGAIKKTVPLAKTPAKPPAPPAPVPTPAKVEAKK